MQKQNILDYPEMSQNIYMGEKNTSLKGVGTSVQITSVQRCLRRICAKKTRHGDVVLLCDHGSPVQRVANAKMAVQAALASALGREVLHCCMERREGEAYDA